MSYLNDLLRRLHASIGWVAAQFWAMLLLAAAGLAWTRLPDKYTWQVLLSLLIPLVLIAGFLLLQAGTMRRLFSENEGRSRFVNGALMLLGWAALVWVAWAILDWCGDQIPLWASYMNSIAPAHARERIFTYNHWQSWLTWLIWICRWIILPGKLIPHMVASAQRGWRIPVRKLIRLLLNWRWWPAVIVAALLSAMLPVHFFTVMPHGTVSHQVWVVIFKLVGSWLLAIACWVMLLAWCATLLARQPEPSPSAVDQQLFDKLRPGRRWLLSLAVWLVLIVLAFELILNRPGTAQAPGEAAQALMLIFFLVLFILLAGLLRSIVAPGGRRVRMIWGVLMAAVWAVPWLVASYLLDDLFHVSRWSTALSWVAIPGVLIPFIAASAQWGVRLPWRKTISLFGEWRWWIAIVFTVIYGHALPQLLSPVSGLTGSAPGSGEAALPRYFIAMLLYLSARVLLLAWFAILLARASGRVQLPLIQGGEDAGGNA